jgi:hypothetical protein
MVTCGTGKRRGHDRVFLGSGEGLELKIKLVTEDLRRVRRTEMTRR